MSFHDLGEQILPEIENLFESSASLLYRCGKDASLSAIGGNLTDICETYGQNEDAADPLQAEESRLNLSVSVLSRLKVWKDYLRSSAFNEFMHPRDADYLLHLRLTDTGYHAPGMVGLVLARSFRKSDFGKKEEKTLGQLIEPLRAVARRSQRMEAQLGLTEALLEEKSRAELALSLDGRLVWASTAARARLRLRGSEGPPEILVAAARKLGERMEDDSPTDRYFSRVVMTLRDGSKLGADLRLVSSASGARLILAEMETDEVPTDTSERLLCLGLTGTEAKVLALLAQGLSDAEIGRRLFVSHATIRTHVGKVLGKLGVRSRTQAALLAHGYRVPEPHLNR